MRETLEVLYTKLHDRNIELDFERYDPSDLNSLYLYRLAYRSGPLGQIAAKLLKMPELVAPLHWRKILGCKKTAIPTGYYHIGMSYIHHLLRGQDTNQEYLSHLENLLDRATRQAIPRRANLLWAHSYPYFGVENTIYSRSTPCGHHCARLSYLLAHAVKEVPVLGDRINMQASSAVMGLLKEFNWHHHENGMTVSYFPNTHDEVINIIAEFAMVLSEALRQKLIDQDELQARERLNGLVSTIVTEQHSSGAWGYYTRRYATRAGISSSVDNHHSAMIITALVRILDTDQLGDEMTQSVQSTLNKGLFFFMERLLTDRGVALYFPESHRQADIAGYCESTIMLCETSVSSFVLPDLQIRSRKLVDLVLERAIQRFALPSGDVASSRHFSRKVNLQSIRWGSGLLMEAVSRYLLLLEKGT